MATRTRWVFPVLLSSALLAAPFVARSQQSSPVVQLLLSGRDSRTRLSAAFSLGRMRPPGARQALEAALGDSDPSVRAAAAEALRAIGDVASLPALRAHRNDPSPARETIGRVIIALESRAPTMPAAMGAPLSTNWDNAQYLLRVGDVANRVDQRSTVVSALRGAIAQEIGRVDGIACSIGTLPPEAERRVRGGQMRVYNIDGTVNQLRRWNIATTLSVRAEVSLVLMAGGSRSIVGSLSGAATAQETTVPGTSSDTLAQRLEERALAGAVRGAVANLRASLSTHR